MAVCYRDCIAPKRCPNDPDGLRRRQIASFNLFAVAVAQAGSGFAENVVRPSLVLGFELLREYLNLSQKYGFYEDWTAI